MAKFKFVAEPIKAVEVKVELPEDITEYALRWLQICNNVREYPHIFFKCENNRYNDKVSVFCTEKEKDSVKEWLEDMGEIKSVDTVYVFKPETVAYGLSTECSKELDKIFESGADIVCVAPDELE